MRIIASRRARQELNSLVEWLAVRSEKAARRLLDRYLARIDDLEQFPELGRAIDDQQRELVVRFGRDGLVIRYEVLATHILITRVFHGAQDRA